MFFLYFFKTLLEIGAAVPTGLLLLRLSAQSPYVGDKMTQTISVFTSPQIVLKICSLTEIAYFTVSS